MVAFQIGLGCYLVIKCLTRLARSQKWQAWRRHTYIWIKRYICRQREGEILNVATTLVRWLFYPVSCFRYWCSKTDPGIDWLSERIVGYGISVPLRFLSDLAEMGDDEVFCIRRIDGGHRIRKFKNGKIAYTALFLEEKEKEDLKIIATNKVIGRIVP